MNIAIDDYGRPFIIMRNQEKQKRLKGIAAMKENIQAAQEVANTVKTSFGPKGLDKIIMSEDNSATVTNDGAEILQKMDIEHEIGQLLVQLSRSQDEEIGDGTTGVVILAGALLGEALPLLEKGIHPLHVARGFDAACEIACDHLKSISSDLDSESGGLSQRERLLQTARTTLCSKFVNSCKDQLAEISVQSVLDVADLKRKDVNQEMIRVITKVGGSLDESTLYHGILLDKSLSHSGMPREFKNPKIALLAVAFEPPHPKTKHHIYIESVEHYKQLHEQEQRGYIDMVKRCKDSGADLILCQWGFDYEANHLLYSHEMPAVRWVGGSEMETLAIATGAKIVGRFKDLTPDKLGTAGSVREVGFGNSSEKMLLVEKTVTVLLRAGNKMALEETERSVHDSICAVRNLVVNPRIVYGGGSCELSCAAKVFDNLPTVGGIQQYGFAAFGRALQQIPITLAENAGYSGIETTAQLERKQRESNNPRLGVNADAAEGSCADMRELGVFESYISKRQQMQLATQVAKIVLKTDDVLKSGDVDFE